MVDWDGERYAEVSGLQRMVAEESITGLALAGDERLLDVGCGDGFITMLLAERLPDGSVVGVDASHRMIDRASARVPFDMLRVQFHVDDVLALPFDHDFDIAVSFNALHWVHDQREALRQIGRSLVDGGRAVLQMVCATERPSIEDVAMQVATDSRWAPAFDGFRAPYVHVEPAHFGHLAEAAGFTVDDLTVKDLSWQFDSVDDFRAWFAVGASDWTSRLPDTEIDAFVAAVVDRYQSVVGEPALFRFGQLRASLRVP
ncbi:MULTISPECIES: class I SAM-dependent methyltransferase [Gordonia]|uniref:Class I SAM-dependent methyltransferase n=1 Tax=Gordonia amicalis TaxID=89053 RepID=A0AAE4R6W9_9ACTN|nr:MULTISPECIES: class I SAM-dependent methyltransferase [Gordonia]KAF0971399.1 Trans-aconitate 2-methyltransferase [Gordonia sp. YY1]MCZ0915259.1 class I SAM-dependent methyltransferase [Gordonia amicalis]MCZ4578369.1 class I SAM-dependent methyltransferase [Gordonia amicalis]MCZ4650909.1 class I SAM-dependent methyltransferase [Gordonia amicalis]MDJ0452985.1 class I SAM-dependent methyltransferase [Gordonia amicalis]